MTVSHLSVALFHAFQEKLNLRHSASSGLRLQRYGFFCKYAIPKNDDFIFQGRKILQKYVKYIPI